MNTVRAEWTKARTLPSTPWLLAGLAVLAVGVGALVAGTVRESAGEDLAKLSLAGLWLTQALAAVIGVLALGNEYGTRMIVVTCAAVPARLRVLLGKASVVVALVLAAGGSSALVAYLLARAVVAGNGLALPAAFSGASVRAVGGTALYLGLVALLALGVAAVVRDTAGALTAVLALLYLAPALGLVVSDPVWHERLQRWSPLLAGMSVQATTNLDAQLVAPWPGLGVLALWTAAALLAGAVTFAVRDA